ncbi:PQQ-dependent catabolism-associated CXXCW motif protein [Agrobacterium sp. a22-2]|uniref:PQQ-dependent catabolism-associated CXXCW motif protein n=1 Tax=Agrobacterium sp. a22-2 TaxID=2283840 RepID=UPI0014473189|nr:PQQ-dependent catabolism-associated CXXCW motif protein [Agrobacterium sp. a22-2]NKN38830.1 PQQ-dependent catabolism-associated CXXCW motif protein [Agrobacterium sp. a22-2]
MIRLRLAALILLVASSVGAIEEPAGYRDGEYRSEVPATLKGATVVSTETAYALWKTGQVAFIDVLPRPPKPDNLPAGTVWNEKPRISVPGALWLPNVGYGKLADVMAGYFRAGLEKASRGDKDRPVLFFCLDGCWMSWNAAKRAVEYGYTHVFWYPEGTDGWTAAGYSTERLYPEPGGQ